MTKCPFCGHYVVTRFYGPWCNYEMCYATTSVVSAHFGSWES